MSAKLEIVGFPLGKFKKGHSFNPKGTAASLTLLTAINIRLALLSREETDETDGKRIVLGNDNKNTFRLK